MTKKENKKKFVVVLLMVLLLALAVGYAAFSDVLTISGTATVKNNADFDLEFVTDDPEAATPVVGCKIVSSDGINTTTSGVSISADSDTLTVNVKDMAYPGAGAVVRAVIKNVGNVPAKLGSLTPTNISGNSHAIQIVGLEAYAQDETIAVGDTCTVQFTVRWDPTVTSLNDVAGENGTDFSFSLVLNYDQDTTPVTITNTHVDA